MDHIYCWWTHHHEIQQFLITRTNNFVSKISSQSYIQATQYASGPWFGYFHGIWPHHVFLDYYVIYQFKLKERTVASHAFWGQQQQSSFFSRVIIYYFPLCDWEFTRSNCKNSQLHIKRGVPCANDILLGLFMRSSLIKSNQTAHNITSKFYDHLLKLNRTYHDKQLFEYKNAGNSKPFYWWLGKAPFPWNISPRIFSSCANEGRGRQAIGPYRSGNGEKSTTHLPTMYLVYKPKLKCQEASRWWKNHI